MAEKNLTCLTMLYCIAYSPVNGDPNRHQLDVLIIQLMLLLEHIDDLDIITALSLLRTALRSPTVDPPVVSVRNLHLEFKH